MKQGRGEEEVEIINVLCGDHMEELCAYCVKMNHKANGLRCAGCLTKLYCGVECQVKDNLSSAVLLA